MLIDWLVDSLFVCFRIVLRGIREIAIKNEIDTGADRAKVHRRNYDELVMTLN